MNLIAKSTTLASICFLAISSQAAETCPNFAGKWKGTCESAIGNQEDQTEVTLEITQNGCKSIKLPKVTDQTLRIGKTSHFKTKTGEGTNQQVLASTFYPYFSPSAPGTIVFHQTSLAHAAKNSTFEAPSVVSGVETFAVGSEKLTHTGDYSIIDRDGSKIQWQTRCLYSKAE